MHIYLAAVDKLENKPCFSTIRKWKIEHQLLAQKIIFPPPPK